VPSSQALPGFLITAPSSVCVSAVLGALAVWIQNSKKKKHGINKDAKKEGTAPGVAQGAATACRCTHGTVLPCHVALLKDTQLLILMRLARPSSTIFNRRSSGPDSSAGPQCRAAVPRGGSGFLLCTSARQQDTLILSNN